MMPVAFKESIGQSAPSARLSGPLQALWWAAKGDWGRAHELVMSDDSREAAWVHAYLHRVEGDLPNARYWYGVAGKPPATGPFEEEWNALLGALLTGEANWTAGDSKSSGPGTASTEPRRVLNGTGNSLANKKFAPFVRAIG